MSEQYELDEPLRLPRQVCPVCPGKDSVPCFKPGHLVWCDKCGCEYSPLTSDRCTGCKTLQINFTHGQLMNFLDDTTKLFGRSSRVSNGGKYQRPQPQPEPQPEPLSTTGSVSALSLDNSDAPADYDNYDNASDTHIENPVQQQSTMPSPPSTQGPCLHVSIGAPSRGLDNQSTGNRQMIGTGSAYPARSIATSGGNTGSRMAISPPGRGIMDNTTSARQLMSPPARSTSGSTSRVSGSQVAGSTVSNTASSIGRAGVGSLSPASRSLGGSPNNPNYQFAGSRANTSVRNPSHISPPARGSSAWPSHQPTATRANARGGYPHRSPSFGRSGSPPNQQADGSRMRTGAGSPVGQGTTRSQSPTYPQGISLADFSFAPSTANTRGRGSGMHNGNASPSLQRPRSGSNNGTANNSNNLGANSPPTRGSAGRGRGGRGSRGGRRG